MKNEYAFVIFCCGTLVLGPLVISFITGNWWWMLLYVFIALIFGMA
jgi:hypothetical protein